MGSTSSALADDVEETPAYLHFSRVYHCPPPPKGWDIFRYTGSDQTFETKGRTTFLVELWGAQGGAHGGKPPSGPGFPGGLGGYARGKITVPPGTLTLTVIVGQGGLKGYQHFVSYGGGGKSGKDGDYGGGGGGGRSAIQLDGSDIITAGGGGGGGCGYGGAGGAGGGIKGKDADGTGTEVGKGGSQTVGGEGGYGTGRCASGMDKVGCAGSFLTGGNADARPYEGAAGGGGGYFGGGAGGSSGGAMGIHHYGGGGGGSGFAGDSRVRYERTELIAGDECFWENPQPDGRPNGLVIIRPVIPDSEVDEDDGLVPPGAISPVKFKQMVERATTSTKEQPKHIEVKATTNMSQSMTSVPELKPLVLSESLPQPTQLTWTALATSQQPEQTQLPARPQAIQAATSESTAQGGTSWQSRFEMIAEERLRQLGDQKQKTAWQQAAPSSAVASPQSTSNPSQTQIVVPASSSSSSTDTWKSKLEAAASARLSQLDSKLTSSKSAPNLEPRSFKPLNSIKESSRETSSQPSFQAVQAPTIKPLTLGSTLGKSLGMGKSVGANSSPNSLQSRLEAQAEARRKQLEEQTLA